MIKLRVDSRRLKDRKYFAQLRRDITDLIAQPNKLLEILSKYVVNDQEKPLDPAVARIELGKLTISEYLVLTGEFIQHGKNLLGRGWPLWQRHWK